MGTQVITEKVLEDVGLAMPKQAIQLTRRGKKTVKAAHASTDDQQVIKKEVADL